MNCAFKKGETISLGLDSFVIEDIVGRGASSIVYRAKHQEKRTGHLLKEYNPQGIELYRDSNKVLRVKNKSEQKRFGEGLKRFKEGYERQINLRMNTSLTNSICNIQRIYEGYGTEFIEMSVLNGKSYDQVTEKTLKDLLLRIKAIAKTASCFHNLEYLLIDIKPANIFTDPGDAGTIWLFDFDSVVSLTDLSKSDNWNPSSTSGWYAPELEDEDCKDYIDGRTDVYSIGMILYYKLTGKLLKAGMKTPQKLNISIDSTAGLLKDIDSSVLNLLTEILSNTLCSFKYRWPTEKLISNLEKLIKELDSLEAASCDSVKSTADEHAGPGPSTPVHVQVDVEVDNNPVVDNVKKQFSKLSRTIIAAAILICIPIFFLVFGSLLPESEAPASGVVETTQTDHLQQAGTTDTAAEPTANTQTEPNSTTTTEDPTTVPTHGIEESAPPSTPDSQSKNAYVIDTIAYTSDNFRSLIVTNDGVVYYLDGSIISNSSDDVSLDMQSDFDAPLENGYLAYDPYNDIVYLLAGGSLSIYDISDLSNPKLVLDDTICPDIVQIVLDYNSGVTPQIAILPDGSLLVPAYLDGTYRVNIANKHFAPFTHIYNLQSPYYAKVVGDYILKLREASTEAKVIPMYGGQEYDIQLDKESPYFATCSVQDKVWFYDDGIGVCQFDIDGTFCILIPQGDIMIRDYQTLDSTHIGIISANENGVIAFYDHYIDCIRYISPE